MGGTRIREIIRSRLPERFAGAWARWSVELAVGVAVPAAFVAVRLPLMAVMTDRAPYALNFLAVIIATVIAGWRSGLLALAVGQLLTWYAVVEPQWSLAAADSQRIWGLVIASGSQALLLLVIALYQREVDQGLAERERRLHLQDQAHREMDHRIRNNFQTVLALIHLQAQRAHDAGAKAALEQVVERIKAIATVTERLTLRGGDLATVSIRDHLGDLCEQLEQGLADGIAIHCDVADVHVNASEATYLGIIVNELVTNALKHAFDDGRTGWVRVEGEETATGFNLLIRDNGTGMKAGKAKPASGLGQKLVQTFVREIGGKYDVSSSETGTVHRIVVPELGRVASGG